MTQIDCQLNPMAIYAEGVDSSDYIDSVAPLIIQTLVNIGDLLDVGAGVVNWVHHYRLKIIIGLL